MTKGLNSETNLSHYLELECSTLMAMCACKSLIGFLTPVDWWNVEVSGHLFCRNPILSVSRDSIVPWCVHSLLVNESSTSTSMTRIWCLPWSWQSQTQGRVSHRISGEFSLIVLCPNLSTNTHCSGTCQNIHVGLGQWISISAGIPCPRYAEQEILPTFTNHSSNIFSRAFGQGQSFATGSRSAFVDEWPLAEFWRDKILPERKVMDSFTEPIMLEALANRESHLKSAERGNKIDNEDLTLLIARTLLLFWIQAWLRNQRQATSWLGKGYRNKGDWGDTPAFAFDSLCKGVCGLVDWFVLINYVGWALGIYDRIGNRRVTLQASSLHPSDRRIVLSPY